MLSEAEGGDGVTLQRQAGTENDPWKQMRLSYGRWAISDFSELTEGDLRPGLVRWCVGVERMKGMREGQRT